MSTTGVPRELSGATPTARLVYLALQASGVALTIAELTERTGGCTSAVKKALADLRERDIVERVAHPTDGRLVKYRVAGTAPADKNEQGGKSQQWPRNE